MRRSKQVSDWACSASGAARKPDLLIELVETGGDAKAEAGAALYRYNVAKSGVADRMPIGAIVRDASGKVIGGVWGRTELGVLFLDMFFVAEDGRGKSYGSRLLSAVETEARKRDCARAVVETSSFQAPGFYVRHGYEEFGRVEFGIPGAARIFLRKEL